MEEDKLQASNGFIEAIKKYLDERAARDPLFAAAYSKPDKNIEDCANYIGREVHESTIRFFEDEEIYSMAVHYYVEDNIEAGKPISFDVAISTKRLSEDQKERIYQDAKEIIENEAYSEMKENMQKKRKPKAAALTNVEQKSLF